jgi:hypothetical protein
MKKGILRNPKNEVKVKKMEIRRAMQKELEKLTCGDRQIAAGKKPFLSSTRLPWFGGCGQ